jgi:ADP-heptose:LPS heptosyltransferase
MKILVIQIARLGDIYMSWPALRALRRQNPQAEIHVLARPRFAAAFDGLTGIHKIIQLPTQEILAPLVKEKMEVQEAFDGLSQFVDQLHMEKYDQIYNFSFSPLSSYLTHYIAHSGTKVCGYTRFKDGFFSIPDDMSAYFYAQVGVGRPNRFHLIEIFSSIVGMDTEAADFRAPHPFPTTDKTLPQDYIVLHVGASEVRKSIRAEKWISIIQEFQKINTMPIVLVGAAAEKSISQQICAEVPQGITDLVGQTQVSELFPILKSAKLLVGCDSAPMHMATLTGTPCVNITFPTVNFWETGPRAMDSVIVRAHDENDLSQEKLAKVIHRSLVGEKQDLSVVHTVAGTPSYWTLTTKTSDFDWLLLRAIYMGEDFPSNDGNDFTEAIRQLSEINELMLQQMANVERTGDISRASPFIERGEEIIETIGKLVPPTQTLVRWYQTEKIRIAPDEMRNVLKRTIEIHQLFQKILDLYKGTSRPAEKELE